jgi:hypothetical protein
VGDLVVLQYHILIKEIFIETYIKTDAQFLEIEVILPSNLTEDLFEEKKPLKRDVIL